MGRVREYVTARFHERKTVNKYQTPVGVTYEAEDKRDSCDSMVGWRTETELATYRMPVSDFKRLAERL